MPASYVQSALATNAGDLADKALDDPEGVAIFYSVDACGSMEAAKMASRRFQVAFNTMRTRDRNRLQKQKGESVHTILAETYSKYDYIACIRNPKENGWEVQLIRAKLIDMGVVVTSISTGEELFEFSPNGKRLDLLREMMSAEDVMAKRERRKVRNPYKPHEVEFIQLHDPTFIDFCYDTWKVNLLPSDAPTELSDEEKTKIMLDQMMESIESLPDRTPQKTA